jgi:hypothetical protein
MGTGDCRDDLQMHMVYVEAVTVPTMLAAKMRRRLNLAQSDA